MCYVCGKGFTEDNYRVRDHEHYSGVFRGAAHNKCNLRMRQPGYVPVIMHNLANYDAHLFIKEFGKEEGDLDAICQTDEKYISFTHRIPVGEDENGHAMTFGLRFIDSFKFMSSSLEKLAANLGDEAMGNLKQVFPEPSEFKLLRRKGVYPYDWMDNDDKFKDKQLPPKEAFNSVLKGEGISDAEYEHAQNVWQTFKCQTFNDYHDLYLKSDTLLLADVYENFRSTCMKTYGLDPAKYYTAPGLSWGAMLKSTGIELDLYAEKQGDKIIEKPDVLLMIEKGIRGGVSTITHRYAKANNPYLPETYDPSKPNQQLFPLSRCE